MTVDVLRSPRRSRIAVLGAGHTGPVIARVANQAGYPVSIAASGDPELIERVGYDAVRFGRLSAGRLLEPGGPVFGVPLRQTEFGLAVRAEAA